ncbi:MAG: 30S ribosomal protein S16 [Candidatus Manganitrophaceae bacterium]
MARVGRHKRPYYRIVAADSQSPRNGRFIEILGTYDPLSEKGIPEIKEENAIRWLKRGAEVTETVRSLFKKVHLYKKANETVGEGV